MKLRLFLQKQNIKSQFRELLTNCNVIFCIGRAWVKMNIFMKPEVESSNTYFPLSISVLLLNFFHSYFPYYSVSKHGFLYEFFSFICFSCIAEPTKKQTLKSRKFCVKSYYWKLQFVKFLFSFSNIFFFSLSCSFSTET